MREGEGKRVSVRKKKGRERKKREEEVQTFHTGFGDIPACLAVILTLFCGFRLTSMQAAGPHSCPTTA